jgi:excinuclease ABC subunit C
MPDPSLDVKLERVPTSPGVYLFHNAEGQILYIGKAKSLRHRIRSYFQSNRTLDLKTDFINRMATDFEYIVTDNEVEALILESTLVKKHQPRLNVRLKDDKAFLHIKLTVNEAFPRVLLTRRIRSDGALYFGPYLPASLARSTIKVINRHFQLRTCSIPIDGKLERPCLEYFIKRCLGPCVSGLCAGEDYDRAVQDVILLLEGRNDRLLKALTEKMLDASRRERYEAAAFFRDRIQLVRELAEKQKMASTMGDDVDVFAYYREGPRLALQLFTLRGGRVVGKREFFWEDLEVFEPAVFLRDAVQQFYLGAGFVPARILLPLEIEDQDIVLRWLNEKRGRDNRRKIRILAPKRGDKLDLLLLVERNAKIAFDARFKTRRSEKVRLLEVLEDRLSLPRSPRLIEAFDISNIQGADTVASMVVCRDGLMSRQDYRRFKIRSVQGPDDFEAMREVVLRRYRRVVDENRPLPDLVLVDGGLGQLHAAYQALSKVGIDEDLALAAIAKREEEIFVQGQEDSIRLDPTSPALHLIQEIRDEAHRFAVTYHRRRRSIRNFESELDGIPGIGEKRRKRLLQNFGSLARIRQASVDELTPYVGRKLAEAVWRHLGERPVRPKA